jgi:transcriptional regulator with XRE-family HTH domain
MELTQDEFAAKLRMTRNSVARMERGEMIVTPPMELLISFIAREAGVDPSHGQTSRGAAASKKTNRGKTRDTVRKSGRRKGR